MTIINKLPN